MPLESASYISSLEPTNPPGTDQLKQADDHLRLIKAVLKNTFPNLNAPVTATPAQLNNPPTIPIGVITAWYGIADNVPSGWALCNGSEVTRTDGGGLITTPNLVDRVVVGAGTIAAQGATAGNTTSSVTSGSAGDHTHTVSGGAHTHSGTCQGTALTTAQLPAHSHFTVKNGIGNDVLSTGNHLSQERTLGGDTQYILNGNSTAADVGKTSTTGSGQTHSHTVSIGSSTHSHTVETTGAHQHSVSVSTVQPVMGLHFIMKI